MILLSGTKFLTAPIVSLNMGFSYVQTLLLTSIGGTLGILFFYYLSSFIVYIYSKIAHKAASKKKVSKKKRVFTWKNKLIVHIKREYGLIGLAALTPILLSIPLGTFLAARYFENPKKVITYLASSVVVWSIIVASVVIIF
ncbi:hypothetical protein ACFLR1_03450 [Bacteroidota bacterium]